MAKLINTLYSVSPVGLQNVWVSSYGYYWRKRRFGGVYNKELKNVKEREWYTRQQWHDYQVLELRKLLVHSYETVPFYNEKYNKCGFTKSFFEKFEIDDLNKLPVLRKEDVRRYGKTTLLSTKRNRKGSFLYSSGSTGTPTAIYFSWNMHQRWSAYMEARVRNWAGVDRFTPRGMIGGRRVISTAHANAPFYRYNFFEKQTYFSAYHISKTTVADYLEGMRKYNVKYMTGYAMSNYFLARMFLENSLEAPALKAVISSSEKLTPEMRRVFEEVYGCKAFDSYSGVEACGLISENQFGELLVSPDVGVMEIVDENGCSVKKGESGEVISTGLLNYDQPLIRYAIGDKVRLANVQATKSGHEMIRVDEIDGRVEDKIIGKDGRVMVRFHSLYIDIPHLIAAQIVQEEIDKFVFNLVVEDGFTKEHEKIISDRLKSQLGRLDVSFNKLSEIPKNENGKFQAVVSKLKSRE